MKTSIQIIQSGDTFCLTGLSAITLARIASALVLDATDGDGQKAHLISTCMKMAVGKPHLQNQVIAKYIEVNQGNPLSKLMCDESVIIIPMLVLEHFARSTTPTNTDEKAVNSPSQPGTESPGNT